MFDKVQKGLKAKNFQSKINKELEKIFHQEEKGDNVILVRADKRFEKIVIDGEERKDIKDLLNDAIKEVDKKAEKKMRDHAGDIMEMLGL